MARDKLLDSFSPLQAQSFVPEYQKKPDHWFHRQQSQVLSLTLDIFSFFHLGQLKVQEDSKLGDFKPTSKVLGQMDYCYWLASIRFEWH